MIQLNPTHNGAAATNGTEVDSGIDLQNILTVLADRWRLLFVAPLTAGALALGITYLLPPTYTAKTVFLQPQQQQSSAAAAIASLGALSGLAGGSVGIKNQAEQYVALMQSANVQDRIIEKFGLMSIYKQKYKVYARKELAENIRISLGKKDGLITIEADANTPQLAADLANQHIAELRRLSSELALTEAQQRRVFFESELVRTKKNLTDAQQNLQRSGFNEGAIKAEPKATAEAYARLRTELTSAEIRLQTSRRIMAEATPEIQQQLALLSALKTELAKLEGSSTPGNSTDYVGNYREYKYQEALFELFSKQYELARVDESREGALIQIIDVATPPERKSKPKRALITAGSSIGAFALTLIAIFTRRFRRITLGGQAPH